MADASVISDNNKGLNDNKTPSDQPVSTIKLSEYASKLPFDAKRRYQSKLGYNNGKESLPDPYLLSSGWKDDPTCWPDLSFGDIYCYLIDSTQRTH